MQVRPPVAALLLTAFIVAAVFGLYLPMTGHVGHEAGCPFAPGGIALCAALLAHVEHWQAAFTAVLVELLVLFALVFVFFTRYNLFDPDVGKFPTSRLLQRVPVRPPLLQELFSQGILNPKVF